MLKIDKKADGNNLTVEIGGRLDTNTAPMLEDSLKEELDGVALLTIDMAELEYISSAGLRVLLAFQKIMNTQGQMKVTNARSEIMDIFEVTGFSDILTIE